MTETPSHRLVQQRIRNRIMEAILTFTQGDDGVRKVWPTEYFEGWFDNMPYKSVDWLSNTALNEVEKSELSTLALLVDQACDATPKVMTAPEFIATGWPSRIQPIAKTTLNVFAARGRFSEEEEEEDPSPCARCP